MTTTEATKIHTFEARGLGVAPFRFISAYEKRGPINLGNGRSIGAPGQPMGTCAYCGTGIAICCVIRDAKGATFEVGSDCVRKTGDAGLRRDVDATIREARNAKARERAQAARMAEPASKKQLELIASFGFEAFRPVGKVEASAVIDRLLRAG